MTLPRAAFTLVSDLAALALAFLVGFLVAWATLVVAVRLGGPG